MNLARLDEERPTASRVSVGAEIYRQISSICKDPIQIDWKAELRTGRITVQLIYSNASNRRQAEQVEAALQEWDLTQNQPDSDKQRFSLHQRWFKNFSAKPCEGHVLLVEVTNEFFAAHKKGAVGYRVHIEVQTTGGRRACSVPRGRQLSHRTPTCPPRSSSEVGMS